MKLLSYIFTFLLVLPVVQVLAQEDTSPFGTLTDESRQSRTVLETRGHDTTDYRRTLEDYRDLNTRANQSYGAQRTALSEQALARAKDVLYTKLGAGETHLENLIQRLGSLNLLSEGDRQVLNSELSKYQAFVNDMRAQIDNATSITALRGLSLQINTAIQNSLNIANYYTIKLSIQKGSAIINSIMERAEVIQAHINAAGELGGDVGAIQSNFDSAMLTLERAKNTYASISANLDTLSPSDNRAVETQFQQIRDTNTSVAEAHSSLKQVVTSLKNLYGRSPWNIDRASFTEGN